MKKLLLTCSLPKQIIDELSKCFEIKSLEKPSKEMVIENIKDVEVLLVRSEINLDEEIIKNGKLLKIIGRIGVGLDNIDTAAAQEKNISVLNTPDANSIAVAELVFAMTLTMYRKLREADFSMKNNRWEKQNFTGSELHNKTIGIIGFGRIGKKVSNIAKAFNMRVMAYDEYISDIEFASLSVRKANNIDEILQNADIITLHIPKTPETENLISKEKLKLMKKNAILINCARGGIIEENALIEALKNNQILGACIDTWACEPNANEELKKLPNVIALPHLGASTKESQERCATEMLNQLFTIYGIS